MSKRCFSVNELVDRRDRGCNQADSAFDVGKEDDVTRPVWMQGQKQLISFVTFFIGL